MSFLGQKLLMPRLISASFQSVLMCKQVRCSVVVCTCNLFHRSTSLVCQLQLVQATRELVGSACLMYDSKIGRLFSKAAASPPANQPAPRAGDPIGPHCFARRSVLNMDGHAAILSDTGSVYMLDRSELHFHLFVVIGRFSV